MQVIFPITAGLVTWGTAIPGDMVALNLHHDLSKRGIKEAKLDEIDKAKKHS